MARLVVVSNRTADPFDRKGRAGGLAIALREVIAARGGLWLGWSGRSRASPDPAPRLSRSGKVVYASLDLGIEEYETYYLGFANSTLWPLCHYRLGLIKYRRADYDGYVAVNARFAAALKELIEPDDLIWVHDYHFIPLGAELRRLGVNNPIGYFQHIPFPPYELLSVLPPFRRLLDQLAAYDLVGVQTRKDVARVSECFIRAAEDVRTGPVAAAAKPPRLGAFAVGIDTEAIAASAAAGAGGAETTRLRDSLSGRRLVLGVDRLDYSKGLPERMEAFGELLGSRPALRGKVTFMQIAPVSRGEIGQYRALRREIERLASSINGRFAEFDWVPVRYLNKPFDQSSLAGFYRVARVGLVTPLRDGMNLVAKEFVAAQDGADPGVLVLSAFAGAAEELERGALIVNPFDVEAIAEAVDRALLMAIEERRARWSAMMEVLGRDTVTTWCGRFLDALEDRDKRRSNSACSTIPQPR